MKFDNGISPKYRKSVEDAFDAIMKSGNDFHRHMITEIMESDMQVRVQPVAKINASGVTGPINSVTLNVKLVRERLSLREALGELYIAIANETIDTGGQRGCEGTFVHEGRHAYDFAQTIESLSNADMNPIGIFNPTLYELEWEAHKTAGDYMVCVDKKEYLDEGLQLMILQEEGSKCEVSEVGIAKRLNESYGLDKNGNQGALASDILGIRV